MSVLDDAAAAVHGARARDYGHPRVNHGCTGAMFRAWQERAGGRVHPALEVCAFNIIQKLSRLANTPDHRDSLVDIAGYAENWGMILDMLDGEYSIADDLRELQAG